MCLNLELIFFGFHLQHTPTYLGKKAMLLQSQDRRRRQLTSAKVSQLRPAQAVLPPWWPAQPQPWKSWSVNCLFDSTACINELSAIHTLVLSTDLPQAAMRPPNKGLFCKQKQQELAVNPNLLVAAPLNRMNWMKDSVSKAHGLSGQLQSSQVGEMRARHWQQ